MTTNLIDSLGSAYFTERYHDKIFVEKDVAYMPHRVLRQGVECMAIVSRDDPKINEQWRHGLPVLTLFDKSRFPNFDVFAYPDMGYRAIEGGAYFFTRDVRRTYSSGFCLAQVKSRSSAVTTFLENMGVRAPVNDRSHSYLRGILWPSYHGKKDLTDLLTGKMAVAVLNPRVLIEPTTRNTYDLYDVWVDGLRIGSILPTGEISKNTPSANRALLEKVLA